LKKAENTCRTSTEIRSQKVEKKDGPKPSGPGLDCLFISVKAFLISSREKASLREDGRIVPGG
jgi:hypothetical protein